MIYTHTINTSPESKYENDDDVIDLETFLFFYTLQIYVQIKIETKLFFIILTNL
ncbi:conserved hypothetical protein [Flavobacterium psychrophilum]|nr:conserved hypothetical protein [Flavobacterium psychrophilum]